jgi:outer membrane protein OmpA-like peptidoglycan-associated protein/tetratricopeptide (TPR) repeat protein
MKKLYFISALVLISAFGIAQKHTEWDKDNFPGQKDQYKEAKRFYEDGKKVFDAGKKEYDGYLESFVKDDKKMPCSRQELQSVGNESFKECLPLLQKANDFNPNHANLNYMIAFCYFCLDPQHDMYMKYFEQAYKLNPNVTLDEKYYMAWGYHLNLRWDEAIKEYNEVLTDLLKDPKKYEVWIEDVKKKIKECGYGKTYTADPQRVFIDNVGTGINSPFPDYGALITADESMMIFTSRRSGSTGGKLDASNEFFEDIYVSYRKGGQWTPAMNLGSTVNSDEHDATAGLSHDGTLLYLYRFQDKDGGDIYESDMKGTTWSKPDHMNKNVNSDKHESTVSLSYDDKQLFIVSDKKGGLGDRDIYYCPLDPKGKWSEAINVGNTINTKYSEEGIFMHPDGKTMYFSSRGHSSMGGFDIFKSEFNNGKWGEPVNLGYPINGPHDDVFFVINASGRRGYYASAKQGGYGEKDIYVITFLGADKPFALSNEDNLIASIAEPVKSVVAAPPVEIKANSLTVLKGTITDDNTKKPVEATIELIDNTKNEVIASFKSNSSTGKYLVTLPAGKNYGIAVKADDYLFHSENFDIPPNNGYLEVTKDVQLKNVAVGTKIVLRNIFFDFDKSTLKPESTNELQRLIKLLNDLPTMKIEIGGHTDSKGSDDYNLKLSASRAKTVVEYLTKAGISADRLKSAGYGEAQPIETNDTDEGRALNRRTEFTILSK